jgi:hypothetical protein
MLIRFLAVLVALAGCTETRSVVRKDAHGRCPGQCVERECAENSPPLYEACAELFRCVPCPNDAGQD